MGKPVVESRLVPAKPGSVVESTPANQQSIPISTIEAKRVELLSIKHQLEFQLNGIVNQLHLIDQLLHPEPPPAPDNTI